VTGRFHTLTLGCKLNQFDTAAIEAELAGRGFVAERDPARADVVVVNTCTVTAKADAEARKMVRSLRRRNPDCRLLVTGCYAEREPETLAAIPGVDLVFGNTDKPKLPSLLDRAGIGGGPTDDGVSPSGGAMVGDRGCEAPLALPGALHFGDRSRAFLRVQEGCDLRCSYCVIPRVRGASRSVPAGDVMQGVRRLLADGYREIVLTGVNTGDWGKDLTPRSDLGALLDAIFSIDDSFRLRLNSLEPRTVTDDIVDRFVRESRLAPHLQIPLQSGCDEILGRMRRNYRTAFYRERLDRLRSRVPAIGLGADVIVGFPGEADEAFEETYRFIEDSPLNYLHVFSWSPRPGVPAEDLPDRPHGTTVRRRSERLRRLAEEKGLAFRWRFAGEELPAVVLGERRDDGRIRILTENFFEVGVESGAALARGALVRVRVDANDPERATLAERAEPKGPALA